MTGGGDIEHRQIENLSRLWHKAVHLSDKNAIHLFDDELSGVTTVEMGIIHLISEHPDYIMRDIIENLELPASTLTSAVNRLEKRGYLQREIAPQDRRSFRLVLTPLGEKAQERHLASEEILFSTVLACLDTPEERDTFMSLLEKIMYNYSVRTDPDHT